MKFTIGTEPLQRALKVLGVVVKANAVDASGRVLVEATESEVRLLSNNGLTAIIFTTADVDVATPGTASIAFNKLKSFAMSFRPWDGISGVKNFLFSSLERNVKVSVDNVYEDGKSSKGSLTLPGFNPALISKPVEFGKPSFTMNSTTFMKAINKVLYAINPQVDLNFAALQGMNMNFDKNSICFVGCDGKVLSEYQDINKTDKKEGSINLQYEFFMGLKRLVNDDVQLFWEVSGNRVAVKFEDIVFIGRTIIGHDYPNYRPALEEYKSKVIFSKDFLMTSLEPFSDVLDPEDNFRLTFEIKDKLIRFYNDYTKIETEQDIEGGFDFSVDVNGKFLISSIDAIRDENILIKFSDEKGALIFDSVSDNKQKALIKPLIKR
jgi:DNA polymerase III sliding clamp (beta) subunit (PCNA family)